MHIQYILGMENIKGSKFLYIIRHQCKIERTCLIIDQMPLKISNNYTESKNQTNAFYVLKINLN